MGEPQAGAESREATRKRPEPGMVGASRGELDQVVQLSGFELEHCGQV